MLNYLFVCYSCYKVGNNRLYNTFKVGGINCDDHILNSVEVMDSNTQEWRMISSMTTRRFLVGVGVLDNLLYAVNYYLF